MKLPVNLTKRFSKALTPVKETNTQPKSMLGTVVKHGDNTFVILDGSTIETPVELAVDAEDGDRVAVQIKDHKATVVNNYTAPPSARTATNFMQLTDEGLVIESTRYGSKVQLVLSPANGVLFKSYNVSTQEWSTNMSITPEGVIKRYNDRVWWNDLEEYGLPSPIDPAPGYENVSCWATVLRMDNILQLRLEITRNDSVASGGTIYSGHVSANVCGPEQYTVGVGFYGDRAIVGRIAADGSILVRNTSPTAVTLSDGVILSFTYIMKLNER